MTEDVIGNTDNDMSVTEVAENCYPVPTLIYLNGRRARIASPLQNRWRHFEGLTGANDPIVDAAILGGITCVHGQQPLSAWRNPIAKLLPPVDIEPSNQILMPSGVGEQYGQSPIAICLNRIFGRDARMLRPNETQDQLPRPRARVAASWTN